MAVTCGLLLATSGGAVEITVNEVACVPTEDNAPVTAQVTDLPEEGNVFLFFRRMHDITEDFYYVQMVQAEDGSWWATFPKPEDQNLEPRSLDGAENPDTAWAAWWNVKETSADRNPNDDLDQQAIDTRSGLGRQVPRQWMLDMEGAALQSWLAGLRNEPVEFYVAVADAEGDRLAQSELMVANVYEECVVSLTREQEEFADDLTIGATAVWQDDETVFHWLCPGIDERIDSDQDRHRDVYCGAVAALPRTVLIPAGVVAGTVLGGVIVDDDDPAPASPSGP